MVQGENMIKRDPSQSMYTIEDWQTAMEVYEKAEGALKGKGQWLLDQSKRIDGFPDRLLLPKGL